MSEASEAVTRAAAHSRRAWRRSKWPSGIQPMTTAATDAKKPTTMAWHCMGNTLVTTDYMVRCAFFMMEWV